MDSTSYTLLDSLKQGTGASGWPRFVSLYEPLLKRWAISQKFPPNDADDLIQEVLLKLFTALSEYEAGGGSFRSWLFRLTVNSGHDFRRRVATRRLPAPDGL